MIIKIFVDKVYTWPRSTCNFERHFRGCITHKWRFLTWDFVYEKAYLLGRISSRYIVSKVIKINSSRAYTYISQCWSGYKRRARPPGARGIYIYIYKYICITLGSHFSWSDLIWILGDHMARSNRRNLFLSSATAKKKKKRTPI